MQTVERSNPAKRLAAAGWGLFFVWIGVVVLAEVDAGVGLMGVGVITLGVQLARTSLGLHVEGCWLVVGLLFLVGGIWRLFDVSLPLVAVLLVLGGLALLVSGVRGKPLVKRSRWCRCP
jgi:hypothetical protein